MEKIWRTIEGYLHNTCDRENCQYGSFHHNKWWKRSVMKMPPVCAHDMSHDMRHFEIHKLIFKFRLEKCKETIDWERQRSHAPRKRMRNRHSLICPSRRMEANLSTSMPISKHAGRSQNIHADFRTSTWISKHECRSPDIRFNLQKFDTVGTQMITYAKVSCAGFSTYRGSYDSNCWKELLSSRNPRFSAFRSI